MSDEGARELRASLRALLAEREKELDAVYGLASLFSRPGDRVRPLFEHTAAILRASMQFPEHTAVSISLNNISVHLGTRAPAADSCTFARTVTDEDTVSCTVRYGRYTEADEPAPENLRLRFEPRERRLLDTSISLLADVVARIRTERALRDSTRKLRKQADELEHKNIALREVLGQIEGERQETRKHSRQYLATFAMPLLRRLKGSSRLERQDRVTIEQLEETLSHVFGDTRDSLSGLGAQLSPRELEICGLIRGGMSSKEVAEFLGISESTVERHRNTIRHKLGLTGTALNLTNWLRSM